jgi:hypothetical protein
MEWWNHKMGATWVKIAATTLGSPTANITFDVSAVTAYTHLMILLGFQGTGGGRSDLQVTLNSDAVTNYASQRTITYDGTNTLIGYNANQGATIAIPDATTGSIFSYIRILIPNYQNTTHNKSLFLTGGFATTSATNMLSGIAAWRNTNNTSAISSIKIAATSNLQTGSSAYLYGLHNS